MKLNLNTTAFRMVMLCPSCGKLHVDRGEWATRLHRTHLCVDDPDSYPVQGCGTKWKPSEFPTVGVSTIQDTMYLDDEVSSTDPTAGSIEDEYNEDRS